MNKVFCDKCGKELKEDKIFWLELNYLTQEWRKPGETNKDESQGCFPFGKRCAEIILKGEK
jgi:hypothetical protein